MAQDEVRVFRTTNLADGVQDEAAKALIGRRVAAAEQAPSAKSTTLAYQYFQESIEELGTPYNVDRIPINVLKQMQRDPMVGFGLHFIYAPIYRANWYIKCEDPRVASFIDNALRRILAQYISQRAQAMVFGFKPLVKRFQFEFPNWTYMDPSKSDVPIKVWKNGNVQAVTWKPFVGLPCDPLQVEPQFAADGSFNGIKWQGGANTVFQVPTNTDDEGTKNIDLQHSLWITNEKASANESLWGYPRIGYAFRPWWSKWYRWALYDRFFERKADPPYQVYFPTDVPKSEDEDGQIELNKQRALDIGDMARSGGTIALPGDVIKGYDERPTTIREWEIREVEVNGDMSHFLDSFEYLDVLILRSLWISELMLTPGVGGTSSKNVAGTEVDFHKEASAALAEEIDNELNRYVIPDLVAANFPQFDGEVKKVTTGFTEADQASMQQAMQWIIQSGDSEAITNMDTRTLLDRLGMPLVSQKEIQRQKDEAAKALEASQPPPVNPDNQGNAGVQKGPDGSQFYVPGRATVTLSETEDFIASLPDTKQFSDKQILAKTKALRALWKRGYKEIYGSFNDHITQEKDKLTLDEVDDLVERIVESWSFSEEERKRLLDSTRSLLRDSILRAGEIELRKVTSDTEFADNEAIAQYLDERSALLVKAISDTVREDLRSYLADAIRTGKSEDEIVKGIQAHFSDFPDWKANRLARTEIKEAYNFATLESAKEKGFVLAQARDALNGPTDQECEDRNGQFFRIDEALAIKDHPNGTLQWNIVLRDKIDIEYVENMPDESDALAYFDDENDIVYLSHSIPQDLEVQYLYALGDSLCHHT